MQACQIYSYTHISTYILGKLHIIFIYILTIHSHMQAWVHTRAPLYRIGAHWSRPVLDGTSVPTPTSRVMAPVLARQFCKLQAPPFHQASRSGIPQGLVERPVATPLRKEAWEKALAGHPDPEWVKALLDGIGQGFRIGMQETPQCRPSPSNSPSAREHSGVIHQYVQDQLKKGYMAGPFPPSNCTNIITSSLAVIPKKAAGKWRVIVDMSSPHGASVNDNLRRNLTHVAFSSVDDAAHLMHHLGPNTLLAKLDIKEAYRLIPVHPNDRIFQGICWQDSIFVDCQLPFGLAFAPAIFSALSEALEWILRQRGVRAVIHYMDDFLLMGAPGTTECSHALATTIATCKELGVPLADDKTEGPITELSFLGIQLNSTRMLTSLPLDKLSSLRMMVKDLAGGRVVRNKQALESLVGHLVHAATVFPLGKAFLNALFATKAAIKPGRVGRLNLAARSELAWWDSLLEHWPGTSVHQFLLLKSPDRHLFTNASGSWGCGAWSAPHWFCMQWSRQLESQSIAIKELLPIVFSVAVWGRSWRERLILCHCDNKAVVSQVNTLHARDPQAGHLLRCLAYLQALYDCRLRATHLPGPTNTGADHLSRNRISSFNRLHPLASATPTQVPQPVVNLLTLPAAEWTSFQWRRMFNDSWRQEWQIRQ